MTTMKTTTPIVNPTRRSLMKLLKAIAANKTERTM